MKFNLLLINCALVCSLALVACHNSVNDSPNTNSQIHINLPLIHPSEDQTIKQIERANPNNPLCKHTPVIKLTTSATTGVAPLTVSFNASKSFDPDKGKIIGWEWSFADGTTVIGKTAEHTFTQPGKYPVMLLLLDDQNQSTNDCAGGNFAAFITVN